MNDIHPNMVLSRQVKAQDFFREWVSLFSAQMPMTEKERILAACMLRTRQALSKRFPGKEKEVLLSHDIRRYMADTIDVSVPNFNFLLGRLRKLGFVVDDDIVDWAIPQIDPSSKEFAVTFKFSFV